MRHLHLSVAVRVDAVLIRTVVKLDRWATSVLAEGLGAALGVPGWETAGVADLTRGIAEGLARHAHGLQRDFLQKSLQETLLYIVGPKSNPCGSQLNAALLRFLRLRGSAGLIRRFLSLHVFNIVWFQTSESVRAVARNQNSFIKDMESLERTCRGVVFAAWKARRMQSPVNPHGVEDLVAEIDRRLRRWSG